MSMFEFLQLPYSRRKRERLFHKLWVYLVIICGVLILIFLTTGGDIHNDYAGLDFPPFDDPFPSENVRKRVDPGRRRYPEDNRRIGRLFRERRGKSSNATKLFNESIKIDPNLMKSGQYHYTNIIVHFDLKGAPPKVDYFLGLLELTAKTGATGILVEWEDMFPWSGELAIVRSTNAYTDEEVRRILQKAKDLKLEVIPLVQTFGHMEWILKYEEFRMYRDDALYPQVVCLGNEKAVDLIKKAIKQVVDMHLPYGIKHFHIGTDEAFQYGTCDYSKKLLDKNIGPDDLALKHIQAIATYTKSIATEAQVLAWHDMFKLFAPSKVKDYGLHQMLELVIWDYSETLVTMPYNSFIEMKEISPTVWASSAFKGADFPAATFSMLKHYETNNLAWLGQMRDLRKDRDAPHFAGIIITGWSRYDHMATLCELLPSGTPSMVVNVVIALLGANKKYDTLSDMSISTMAKEMAHEMLGCKTPSEGIYFDRGCKFPGAKVYDLIESSLYDLVTKQQTFFQENHKVSGWMSRYNIAYNMSQSWHLHEIVSALEPETFLRIALDLEREMSKLFHKETVDEFLFTKVDPALEKAVYYTKIAKHLQNLRTFKRRSFKIERKDYAKMLENWNPAPVHEH